MRHSKSLIQKELQTKPLPTVRLGQTLPILCYLESLTCTIICIIDPLCMPRPDLLFSVLVKIHTFASAFSEQATYQTNSNMNCIDRSVKDPNQIDRK